MFCRVRVIYALYGDTVACYVNISAFRLVRTKSGIPPLDFADVTNIPLPPSTMSLGGLARAAGHRPVFGQLFSLGRIAHGNALPSLSSRNIRSLDGECGLHQYIHPSNIPTGRRSIHSSQPAEAEELASPSTDGPVTAIAQRGSNQLSLETPRNRAGPLFVFGVIQKCNVPFPEYVLSTLDKVANWARQGSMWPMTFGSCSCNSIEKLLLDRYSHWII